MQVLLRDLAPGQQYAIQFRSNDGQGNTSEWSQVQRFTTTADTMPPADVQNLTMFSSGTSFVAEWDRVSTNADGTNLLDFKYYHVNVASVGATGSADFYVLREYFEFTQAMNIQAFGTAQTALTITVTAVDNFYNESRHGAVITVDPAAPPTPSTPVVSNFLGMIMVTWDGKSAAGTGMPLNTNYAEVHCSVVSGFTPDPTTMVGRVFADGSGSKYTIPGLVYGTTYYIRLVAVNLIGKRSGPSTQASGIPSRLTGLDIQNGQIGVDQINFTARDIGGANAYYSTSQPTAGNIKDGDIWYDTDNGYTTYRFSGGTWVLAPEVGIIAGTKILAGTLTADAVGTNLLIASSANIGTAVIDDANIANLSAAKITTGNIAASQSIIAGPAADIHAEMRDTGFYVYAPGQQSDPSVPPPMNPVVKMGTGDGDTFSVTDPNDPSITLASISQGGVGSFQDLYVQQSPVIMGRDFASDWMMNMPGGVVGEGMVYPINGLNQSGSMGIRDEYGIGQFSFPVQAGRTYQISSRLTYCYLYDGGEARHILRVQQDQRTSADIAAGVPPTAATLSSPPIADELHADYSTGSWMNPEITTSWRCTYTGWATVGFSLRLAVPPQTDSVIKIPDNSSLTMRALDLGESIPLSGNANNMGGNLYSWTAPAPAPAPSTTNYKWSGHYNWVRSYKSNNGYMSNTNGLAYQGLDPSGYNGNQMSLYGFSQVNFATMLSGATNISVKLYVYYAHWYYNSGGTAVLGYSGQYGDPGTANYPGGSSNHQQVGGVPKPGSFTVDITGWALSPMKSGAFRSVLLGPGPSTSETYYGYASDCALTVYYTK